MAIANKFLYFSTVAAYNAAKKDNNIAPGSIVFVDQEAGENVEAQRFIETHGKQFHANQAANSIKAAIEALDVTDLTNSDKTDRGVTITLNEVDGKVTSLTISDLGGAKLGSYSKGESDAAIVAGDTIAAALAKLENQIANKIGALDSDVSAGDDKYFTGIELKDGKLVGVSEAGSKSTVANVDTAKVVDYVESNSATAQDINTTDTIAQALAKVKRNVEVEVADREAAIRAAIQGLDGTTVTAGNGQFIKSISETDGIVSATTGEMPTVAEISGTGQAIIAVSQTKGTIAATAGDIEAGHVTYTPQVTSEEGAAETTYDTANTNVQAVLKEIFEKIANNAEAGEVAVYKNGTKVNTIAADGETYTIKQGTTDVATINIAKDMVVSSGSVITATGEETDVPTGTTLNVGEKYVRLVIKDSTDGKNIYIAVNDLYDDYTFTDTDEIDFSESNNEVTASIKTGSIAESKLDTTLQNKIANAKTTIVEVAQTTPDATKHITVTKTTGTGSTADSYTIAEHDIASAQGLTDEIARAKNAETAIDAEIGLTKGASGESREYSNTGNYIGKDATKNTIAKDIKALDTQAKANADAAATAKTVVNAKTPSTNEHITVTVAKDSTDNHDIVTISENDIASAQLVGTIPAGAGATTVTEYAAAVASSEADAAETAAKNYANAITVNGQSQASQAITIEADDIDIQTGYAKADSAADIIAGDSVSTALGKVEKKIDNLGSASPFKYATNHESTKSTVLKGENLNAQNEGEVAIGKYNVSRTGSTAANTTFTIGNGTSATPANAFEVRENGDVYVHLPIGNLGADVYAKLQEIIANEINWYEG
jgi:hypothetical protein